LQTEAERAENSVIVRPAAARPLIVAPTPIEDLEDDEEEEDPKPVRAVAAAPVARKVEAVAPVDLEDDEDDDDDDDDDDDVDEDVKDEEPVKKAPDAAVEPVAEPKKDEANDGWEET